MDAGNDTHFSVTFVIRFFMTDRSYQQRLCIHAKKSAQSI